VTVLAVGKANGGKGMWKKHGFIFTLEFAVVMAVFAIALTGGAYFGQNIANNHRTNQIETEGDTIDRALENYAQFHRTVAASDVTMDSDGKLWYNQTRLYPDSLTDLANAGYLTSTTQFTKFTYSVNSSSLPTQYQLTATLANGTTYTSPRSNL